LARGVKLDILRPHRWSTSYDFAVKWKRQHADSVELRTPTRAVSDLPVAVTSRRGKYGDVPTVMQLRNDLERLELDVPDVCSPPPTGREETPPRCTS
jgi:hypothetical protein